MVLFIGASLAMTAHMGIWRHRLAKSVERTKESPKADRVFWKQLAMGSICFDTLTVVPYSIRFFRSSLYVLAFLLSVRLVYFGIDRIGEPRRLIGLRTLILRETVRCAGMLVIALFVR